MIDERGIPLPGWKKAAEGVFIHEDDALISVDAEAFRCGAHGPEVLCRRCLPRLVAAVDVARRCLDPAAEAAVEELLGERASGWPEHLALVNPVACNAFAMRFSHVLTVRAVKTIFTTKKESGAPEGPVSVVDYVTENPVCDASHLRGFRVRLGDGIPEAYVRRLWEARFSFLADGEPLVDHLPLRGFLGVREFALPKPAEPGRVPCLFSACTLKPGPPEAEGMPEADTERWLGFMCPNGTRIRMELEGVPGGGGLIRIEVGWELGVYTTKPTAH